MAMNPSKIKPVEVVRLLNSTRQGEVLSESKMARHRNSAGFKISDDGGQTVNIFKYAAWLREKLLERQNNPPQSYEEKKAAARSRNIEMALAGRDIGELPAIANMECKKNCEKNFRRFCESYFAEIFRLAWSPDHLKVIAKIESAVLKGGLFAIAMPRGSGKSTLAEIACIWSMLYGHREFITLIGATESAALEMLDSIKTELEVNENLAADFPEVSFPIAALDGIANRCAGQLYHGERTRITWTANEIVLPTIAGSKASGIVVRVAGITGRVRGMKFKRADGRSVRPSLVIIDDPQTSESAGSLEQTRKRVRVLAGDILGLAGPGQKMSGIMPCTIIRPGDMAEQILDRACHPEWNGERTKMLYKLPANEKIWEEYAEIRADSLREDGNIGRATMFYINNREAMDAGAQVSWEARFNHDEVSAIQHAMNLKLQDEVAFWSEYQNEPLPEDLGSEEQLSIDLVIHKLNGRKMCDVPVGCNHLSMFIDVQKNLLFYMICAWEDDFTGYVIDYGAYPDQQRRYFSLNDANPTLGSVSSKAGMEGSIYAGLERLSGEYLSKEFRRDDGAMMKIGRCLIDANWGQSTEVVYQFCRQSPHSAVIIPSHGKYIGASSRPMSEYKKSSGDKVGHNWRIPNVAGKRVIRHVIFDTNYWKTFVHARFFVAMGDRGCLSLWGRDPERHLLLAEHLTAEYKVRTTGHGRSVDEWKMRPDGKDNHWLDGVVGCAVGASMLGAILPGTDNPKMAVTRPILKLSELQKKKR